MNTKRPSNRIVSFAIGALLATALPLAAQQPSPTTPATAPQPTFDVVSIRENKSDSGVTSFRPAQDGLNITNLTLTNILINAYNIRPELMSGLPHWADSTRFDVNAKVSDPGVDVRKLPAELRRVMMVALLADRFHLHAHIETKTLPVYDIVIAKGGIRLKENAAVSSPGADSAHPNMKPGTLLFNNNNHLTAVGIPLSMLASNLAFQVERNVIDKTGLTGKYDFDLKWTPAEQEGKTDGITDNAAPDLFTALQEQLGLKLQPSKGPVDTLVIDHVEMPTEN